MEEKMYTLKVSEHNWTSLEKLALEYSRDEGDPRLAIVMIGVLRDSQEANNERAV